MDKVSKSGIKAVVVEVLDELGIAKNAPSITANMLNDVEKSDLSESTKKTLAGMLTKAETLDKSLRSNSIVATSPGPASSEIDALAKQFVQKSNKPVDMATARNEIRKLHPALAEQERAEYRHF